MISLISCRGEFNGYPYRCVNEYIIEAIDGCPSCPISIFKHTHLFEYQLLTDQITLYSDDILH